MRSSASGEPNGWQDAVLAPRAARELQDRSGPGTISYLALTAILFFATNYQQRPLDLILPFVLGSSLLALLRLHGARLLAAGKYRLFNFSTFGVALVWGLHGAHVVYSEGISETALLTVLCMAGVSSGAVNVLAPTRRLAMAYQLALLGPLIMVLPTHSLTPATSGLLLMIWLYLAYQAVQTRRLHQSYWRALRTAFELEQTNAEIAAASTAKSHFLANMSHELRTPLTAIRGFADLMLDGIEPDETAAHAATIVRNSDHLLAIINDILDLSRVEAGRMKVEPVMATPGQVVRDVEALLRVRAVDKGNAFSAEAAGLVPSRILTDPLRLRQILLNLVSNAIRHTEDGEIGITVELRDVGSATPRLAFSVRDTGVGMTEAQLAQLFKPFSQVDAQATRRTDGTGLGLVISRELARLLGGEIQITSRPGEGTTATLIIPTGSLDGVPLWGSLRGAASTDPFAGAVMCGQIAGRVLVVEDDPDAERLVRAHLERAGATVIATDDGGSALTLVLEAEAQGQPFNLILMDMRLPGLDGYATTRTLRQQGYRGAIAALTASTMAGDRERCLKAGCDDYLAKPIERHQLLELVAARLVPRETEGPAS
jgi:signal transduction histidine kinase/ActR/RegA family two-component response regulator